MIILKLASTFVRTVVSDSDVVKTPAFHNFERNLEYVHQLISAGRSLATFKPANLDVGDLYRAAWVQAVAALDYWVSQEIYSRAIRLAREPGIEKPKKFRDFAIPMAVFEDVHHHRIPLEEALGGHLRKFVTKNTFQQPDGIKDGLAIVTSITLWDRVAEIINQKQSAGDLKLDAGKAKEQLHQVVARRNRIAHEADRVADDASRKTDITAEEVTDAVATVEQTCEAILIALQESPEGALTAEGPAPRISEELTDQEPEIVVDGGGESIESPLGDWEFGTKPYGVHMRDLIERKLIEAGAEIRGTRGNERFSATVAPDGRVRLASGQLCTSPSKAGQVVLKRQSCNGWTFWKIQFEGAWVPLEVLRDKYLNLS
ncbi:hypothetical protein OHA77_29690 [Streptosporangium sp. NBC_01639]|uniref:restriction system modified-DNA reader domain-containing protein n=1 Tax=Streptosporangium sp. NBC_01639 TaxID=2975948 RepID=UPI00386EA0DE|nr:hypothetical protein OHA77_29690 [Streptosporangium sp. NBC_01639]